MWHGIAQGRGICVEMKIAQHGNKMTERTTIEVDTVASIFIDEMK